MVCNEKCLYCTSRELRLHKHRHLCHTLKKPHEPYRVLCFPKLLGIALLLFPVTAKSWHILINIRYYMLVSPSVVLLCFITSWWSQTPLFLSFPFHQVLLPYSLSWSSKTRTEGETGQVRAQRRIQISEVLTAICWAFFLLTEPWERWSFLTPFSN